MGRVGLLWIGESFYPRPVDFLNEAANLGISRRLSKVPRAYKAGETWVLFAHPKAILKARYIKQSPAETGPWLVVDPKTGEAIEGESFSNEHDARGRAVSLDLQSPVFLPGIVRICRPRGFEKIVKQSDYDRVAADRATWESNDDPARTEEMKSPLLMEFETDAKRGVTWVPVPDDDKDHMGSVHDRKEEETV